MAPIPRIHTSMDPDPYLWLMHLDPGPGGPKSCGSYGSGSATLVNTVVSPWLRRWCKKILRDSWETFWTDSNESLVFQNRICTYPRVLHFCFMQLRLCPFFCFHTAGDQKDMSSILADQLRPNAGGWGGMRGLNQWVQLCTWSTNKLLRSNSIFNLWRTGFLLDFGTEYFYQFCLAVLQILTIRVADPDPDSIGSVDPDPGGQKWPTKVENTFKSSCFEVLDGSFESWRLLL